MNSVNVVMMLLTILGGPLSPAKDADRNHIREFMRVYNEYVKAIQHGGSLGFRSIITTDFVLVTPAKRLHGEEAIRRYTSQVNAMEYDALSVKVEGLTVKENHAAAFATHMPETHIQTSKVTVTYIQRHVWRKSNQHWRLASIEVLEKSPPSSHSPVSFTLRWESEKPAKEDHPKAPSGQ